LYTKVRARLQFVYEEFANGIRRHRGKEKIKVDLLIRGFVVDLCVLLQRPLNGSVGVCIGNVALRIAIFVIGESVIVGEELYVEEIRGDEIQVAE